MPRRMNDLMLEMMQRRKVDLKTACTKVGAKGQWRAQGRRSVSMMGRRMSDRRRKRYGPWTQSD